jgi:CheY-like chemotaxis protein
MAQPDSRETSKKTVSEILKHLDQLIKAGNIEGLSSEIIRAKEIDPSNPYVRAFEERLVYLKEEQEKNAAKERTRKETEQAARLKDEELRRKLEHERKRQSEEDRRKSEEQKEQGAHDTSIRKQSEHGITHAPRMESGAFNILLIDDDEDMLSMIREVLIVHGYQVTSLATSDEALVLLKKWKPSLILCDVDLKTSTMGGFTFYEKAQGLENLHDVPFVFLTGLTDEIIMNRGKELGADDYLTKPVSEQSLISTIKGKLKRYGRLNKGKKQVGN